MKPKRRPSAPVLLINILVAVLLVLTIFDLTDVLLGGQGYPFGSELFTNISIYRSKGIYISYSVLFILLLICTIIAMWLRKQNQKGIYLLLAVDGLLLFYPLISNR